MKILIIEDEKILADSIEEYLQEEGYICEKASKLSKAGEKTDLYAYDCIIVDIGLPDGSGLDIIKKLKQKKIGNRHHHHFRKKFPVRQNRWSRNRGR